MRVAVFGQAVVHPRISRTYYVLSGQWNMALVIVEERNMLERSYTGCYFLFSV